MERQLVLLDDPRADWRLDEATRRRGLQGVADARAVLRDLAGRAAA
ncbi:MAG TPA: hypothetical protein VFJ85_12360 [Acidimicrobiales bacterium]|nr:hypothetical protein [Acidimicrobiales bacterium]